MTCTNPIEAWRSAELNENGKRPLVFNRSAAFVDMPLKFRCGKCLSCEAAKARDLAVRVVHEAQTSGHDCSFISLTYSDEHLPSDGLLKPRDMELFWKRARKEFGALRYYGCGEYGGRTLRPHFHAIVFGQLFREGIDRYARDGSIYYEPPRLEQCWGMGRVHVRPMAPAAAFYTTGYLLKKNGAGGFHRMSTRPFLGAEFLHMYALDMARQGFCIIEGKKMPIPRTYIERPEYSDVFERYKAERVAFASSFTPDEVWERRTAQRGRDVNLRARFGLKGGRGN